MMNRKWLVLIGALGLLVATCGGAGSASEVRITATEGPGGQSFTSDLTSFKVGESYHFVIENTGVLAHEFMIIQPLGPGMMAMEELDEIAMYVVEEEDLPAGGTFEFDYTFPAEAEGQPLEFACYLPGHYESGMHLSIIVES